MEEYYRVELYDKRKGCTRGGFVAAALAMIHTKLGVSPDIPDEQRIELIANSTDPDVKYLDGLMRVLLGEIDPPEEYVVDKLNRFCLFTPKDFGNKEIFFESLSGYVDSYLPHCKLVYCIISLSPDEILYKDEHQVVVSKEVYEEHQPTTYYEFDDDDTY